MECTILSKRHLTEHTHCVSELNWKLLASLHRERLRTPSKCSAFARFGSYSVTALAVAKAQLLGDMPKRHVVYALTLDAICKSLYYLT